MFYCYYSDLALSVCRSTDLESKPEGRQARKQRKMVAIQARLIVPLPPVVMSLEHTVSSINASWRGIMLSDRSAEETARAAGGKPLGVWQTKALLPVTFTRFLYQAQKKLQTSIKAQRKYL
ncbi:unnamed protein product, partial [Musa hybrid cultivar]